MKYKYGNNYYEWQIVIDREASCNGDGLFIFYES